MDRVNSRAYLRGVLIFAVSLVAASGAQSPVLADSEGNPLAALLPAPAIPAIPVAPAPAATPLNSDRIMGVIPDFQTVRDPNAAFVPLTPKHKWSLAFKENVDPFNIASAAMAAGFSQMGNQTPKYGEGGTAYSKRFGAALADLDRKSTRLNSSHLGISYAVFCLKKK